MTFYCIWLTQVSTVSFSHMRLESTHFLRFILAIAVYKEEYEDTISNPSWCIGGETLSCFCEKSFPCAVHSPWTHMYRSELFTTSGKWDHATQIFVKALVLSSLDLMPSWPDYQHKLSNLYRWSRERQQDVTHLFFSLHCLPVAAGIELKALLSASFQGHHTLTLKKTVFLSNNSTKGCVIRDELDWPKA